MTRASPAMAEPEWGGRNGDAAQLLRIWLSPSFPVGAYAYSHGLEAAVAQGFVATADELADWIWALIEKGSLRNDLILLAEAWRAVTASDFGRLAELNATAIAFQPSAERYLETTQQGGSFAMAIAAAWPCGPVDRLRSSGTAIGYPVAVGCAAAGHAIGLPDTLRAYGLAFVMNLVSAAIRLSVTGQTDGQRVVARLLPAIEAQAATAATLSVDDLGGAALSSDLASLEHETLYSRLFRS